MRANGVHDGVLNYESCMLYVPRVELPVEQNAKLYKAISSGGFKKKLNWDLIDPHVDGFEITANNRNFNFLITNGKQAIKKIYSSYTLTLTHKNIVDL